MAKKTTTADESVEPTGAPDTDPASAKDEKPAPKKRASRAKKTDAAAAEDKPAEKPAPKKRASRAKKADAPDPAPDSNPDAKAEEAPKPKKRKSRFVVDLTSSTPAAPEPTAVAPKKAASKKKTEEPSATDEAPPKRRRTRKTADSGPVASSDNLPADVSDGGDASDADGGSKSSAQDDSGNRSRQQSDSDDDNSGRRKRKRNRNKNKGGQNDGGQNNSGNSQGGTQQNSGNQNNGGGGHPGEPFEGMLELIGDKKFGFIRAFDTALQKGDNDAFCPPPLIQKYNLRDGVKLSGIVKPGRKGAWQVDSIDKVMDVSPEEWAETPDFDRGAVIYPEDKLNLVTGPHDISMRVVDLITPLGKGQRALIVAPPRAGKTVLLKGMAAGIAQNHPEAKLVCLLIDERPEEVTDFKRNTDARVFASSNDYGEDNHVRVATLAFEYSRRLVEQGHDVVVLLDSLTRLGRTFNLFGGNSGRTMSGGLDARALLMPRKIFSSARNIEGGGSLTIIATALVETGSRMDDVIFEEFKGTGNAEIVLDRELSEKRVYPAISIRKSGTRNEERLVPDELIRQRNMLLRALNSRHPVEAMQALVKQVQLSPTNVHLLNELIPESA